MRFASVLPMIAAIGASTAFAQQITLYENENFNGRRFAAEQSVQNLEFSGFNDRASSAVVRGGSWQICTDAYFRGRCVTLGPGDYPSLAAMGLDNRASSVREIGWNSGGPASGGGGPGEPSIVLYGGYDLSGRSYELYGTRENLGGSGFNDRAQSADVRRGTWVLCSDAEFQGNCQEFGPGRYPNLGALAGRVSSARVVAGGRHPGGAGGSGWGGARHTRVILYSGPNFSGRAFPLASNYFANFGDSGFNDRTASIRVERGYWLFCSDANFQGECRTLGPGDYATLPYGLSNRISSARRISEEYPYNGPPNWR
jgi:hypothetical protein